MKIHTNKLTARHVHAATGDLPGVYAEVTTHGSRDHARALNVKLEGNGRRGNSGSYGAMDDGTLSASWDEWGVIIARLFALDPDARFGDKAHPTYLNRAHYHWSTGNRFLSGEMPTDTHKAHRFEYQGESAGGAYAVSYCKGSKGKPCSAITRRVARGTWEDIAHAMDWPTFADMA